jgi:pilin isopeptide linkage protein
VRPRAGRKLAALVAIALVLGALAIPGAPWEPFSARANAADPEPTDKVADPATDHEYPGSADTTAYYDSTIQSGRVWADKTVYADEVTGDGQSPNQVVVTPSDTDEFVVELSAMGSTRVVSTSTPVPIDLVIVIDVSSSMAYCVGSSSAYCYSSSNWQNSRAYAMAQAVNEAVRIVMTGNPLNRVAIVAFGYGSTTVAALQSAAPITGTTYARLVASGTNANNQRLTLNTFGNGSVDIGGTGGAGTQATNLQRGIYAGLALLAGQSSASVTGGNQRIPNVLIFTDGEPTLSATDDTWWNISTTGGNGVGTAYNNQGPHVPPLEEYTWGNGFKAMMTAAYMKNKVTAVYNADPSTTYPTRIYTVGLGISSLATTPLYQSRNLAYATLDPRTWLGNTSNTQSAGITNAWTSYSASATATVAVPITSATATYTVTHPTGADGDYDPTSLVYNEAFYAPATTQDLIQAFQNIANLIVQGAVNYPVQIANTATPLTSGHVTFTDYVGDFMEVRAIKSLVFCAVNPGATDPDDCTPTVFITPTSSSTVGDTTTYRFTGTVTANSLYPNASLCDTVCNITLTVKKNSALAIGDTVTWQIPVALLPMRLFRVVVNPQTGNPISMTSEMAHPVHLYYTVGPKEKAVENLANPAALAYPEALEDPNDPDEVAAARADAQALATYITNHTVEGEVRFYSNDWEGTDETDATARTWAEFLPDTNNGFYRLDADTPLYATNVNGVLSNPITDWDKHSGPVYYYTTDYGWNSDHTALVRINTANETTKAAIEAAVTATTLPFSPDGVTPVTAPAGLPIITAVDALGHAKCDNLDWVDHLPACASDDVVNPTQTDPDARRPGVDTTTNGSVAGGQNGLVTITLGNNGYLAYPVPGSLKIDKLVEAEPEFNPSADTLFTFKVTFTPDDSFSYSIYDENYPNPTPTIQTITSGGTIELTASQTATVFGLPDGTVWTVTEVQDDPDTTDVNEGYSLTKITITEGSTVKETTLAEGETSLTDSAEGKINTTTAAQASVRFTNKYEPASVTHAPPVVVKTITGRKWQTGDTFTFTLCPDEVTSTCQTLTLAYDDGTDDYDRTGTFADFVDEVSWDQPGTYTYFIKEVDDTQPPHTPLPGITYSSADYRWTVTVVDNGSGQLKVTDWVLTQVLGNNGQAVDPDDAQVASWHVPEDGSPPATDNPGTATFINPYDAKSVSGTLNALKEVTDLSYPAGTAKRAPNVVYTFTFEHVLTTDSTGAVIVDSGFPTFDGVAEATAYSVPGSFDVRSPQLTFKTEHSGNTYYYKATEPEDPDKTSYITYDARVWVWKLVVNTVTNANGEDVVNVTSTHCVTEVDEEDDPLGNCSPDEWTTGTTSTIPTFVNEYKPKAAKVDLTAVKVFTGRDWASECFTFTLAANNDTTQAAIDAGHITLPSGKDCSDADGPYATVNGTTNAVVSFPISFSQRGNYQFVISEVPGQLAHVTYSEHTLVYNVTVTDSTTEGALQATATVQLDASTEFVNTYAEQIVYAGSRITKNLDGRAPVHGEFSFKITPADDKSAAKAGIDLNEGRTVTNGEGTSLPSIAPLLGQITFTQDDIGIQYSYTVSEVPGSIYGVTVYDESVYTVTLEAVYDPNDPDHADQPFYVKTTITKTTIDDSGALQTTTPEHQAVVFNNVYSVDTATLTPPLTFTKKLEGKTSLDDQFTFTLRADDPEPLTEGGATPARTPLPATTTVTVTTADLNASGVAEFGFGDIVMIEPGIFTYHITETPGNIAGMTYDTHVATVVVTVTEVCLSDTDLAGLPAGTNRCHLEADIDYETSPDFVNTYTSTPPPDNPTPTATPTVSPPDPETPTPEAPTPEGPTPAAGVPLPNTGTWMTPVPALGGGALLFLGLGLVLISSYRQKNSAISLAT